jgi:hypothetical protein
MEGLVNPSHARSEECVLKAPLVPLITYNSKNIRSGKLVFRKKTSAKRATICKHMDSMRLELNQHHTYLPIYVMKDKTSASQSLINLQGASLHEAEKGSLHARFIEDHALYQILKLSSPLNSTASKQCAPIRLEILFFHPLPVCMFLQSAYLKAKYQRRSRASWWAVFRELSVL